MMFSCPMLASGQVRLQFVDNVTGEPVPYVHVIFGDHEGKYANEGGMADIPDGVLTARASHISYEPMALELIAGEMVTVKLIPVVTELKPAIIVPGNLKKKTIGYASAKGESTMGGLNGFALAEHFSYSTAWSDAPWSMPLPSTSIRSTSSAALPPRLETKSIPTVPRTSQNSVST